MFWQRVTIQTPVPEQTPTGYVRARHWDDAIENVEARLLPLVTDERHETWATPEEDAYEVQLRHGFLGIRPKMRVLVDDVAYDIRRVIEPPPFGDPSTILQVVRITP